MSHSEAARLSWRDPESRSRRIAGMLASWDNPLRLALARGFRCGHDEDSEENRTSDDRCRLCNRIRQRRWLARHRPEHAAYLRAWRAKKKEGS